MSKKAIPTISPWVLILIFSFLLPGCTRENKTWISGWKETTPLDIPRAGAAAVVAKDIIYLIGGVDGKKFLNKTIYSKIREDGSLGPWTQGPDLNEERGFIDAVVYKDFIYVIGGGNGPYGEHLLNSVERARILPDGSLTPWHKEKNHMVIPRRCSKAALIGNTIYSFGGYGGVLLDNVERVEILEDGSLGEWKIEEETMIVPRYINGIKEWNHAVYVVGGHDQKKGVGVPDVEWMSFERETEIERRWKGTSPLLHGRYGLATAFHNGYIYALGGISGAEYLDSAEKSSIDPLSGLSQWKMTTPLPEPRATFNVIVNKDWIYIIGGTNRDGYFTDVSYATFNKEGEIGFWGTKSEAAEYAVRMEEIKGNKKALSNEGVVLEIIQASAYSYVQVRNKEGVSWLAGPKTDLNAGAHIRYSEGVYMSNFYSKELQRNFPSILFVGTIEKVE